MKISNHQMCNEGGAPLFIMIAEKQIERSRKEQETNEQGKMRGEHRYSLLEIRSFTTTILGFSRPEIGGRGIPRRKKVCFSRPHVCGRDR